METEYRGRPSSEIQNGTDNVTQQHQQLSGNEDIVVDTDLVRLNQEEPGEMSYDWFPKLSPTRKNTLLGLAREGKDMRNKLTIEEVAKSPTNDKPQT